MNAPRWFYYVVALAIIVTVALVAQWRMTSFYGKCELSPMQADSTMTVNCVDYRTAELTIKKVH